jgi:hypothetical protein
MTNFKNVVFHCTILLSFAMSLGSATASGLFLDPTWVLTVDQDFTKGDAPSLYNTFCGAQGNSGGPEINNFSKQNLYWEDGALTLKFERHANTSCTGVTREYAGAGFAVNSPAATNIAVEFEILATDVYGVSPYATLWPTDGVKPNCGWGAEDDFFEQDARTAGHEVQTYHHWTPPPACIHLQHQSFQTISTIASVYHSYSVIRDGGTKFFVDGNAQTFSNGQKVVSDDFQNYSMTVQMGIGGNNASMPDDARLPAYVRIRRIKIWYKRN